MVGSTVLIITVYHVYKTLYYYRGSMKYNFQSISCSVYPRAPKKISFVEMWEGGGGCMVALCSPSPITSAHTFN